MPRTARVKSNDSVYHIMVKSVGDIKLYKDNDDKEKYLQLLKRYQLKFGFKVYAYCLMDNHSHILINSNGADVSKFMHGVNQCYAQYFNVRYNRKGHVFGDRFKSKIVKDDRYLLTLSAYIHNNTKDLKRWNKSPEKYPYSSLSIYLGILEDKYNLVEYKFILELFDKILNNSRKKYIDFVGVNEKIEIKNDVEFRTEKSEYRSEKVKLSRDYTPDEIFDFVSDIASIHKHKIKSKYIRESSESKAIAVFLMRRFCDFTIKDICKVIGDISQSRVSTLCTKGLDILTSVEGYLDIIEKFETKRIS